MSIVAINTELRTRYNTWVNKPPTEFPNQLFTPPNPPSLWARFTIVYGEEIRMDIGTGGSDRTYRKVGTLIIQLFDALNKGNNAVLSKSDEVAAIFRNWCGATITCGASTIEEIGIDNNGAYQCNISIPFRTDNLY